MLQQNLDALKLKDVNGIDEGLEGSFVVGQLAQIISDKRRMGEVCEVIGVMKKSVWFISDNVFFLKGLHRIALEVQAHTLKKVKDETAAEWQRSDGFVEVF